MFSRTLLRSVLPMTGLAFGASIGANALAGAPTLDVIVYSGLNNSPPNFSGLFWNLSNSLSNPVIDDSGRIAFVGTMFGDGITPANNRVLWYGDEAGWTNVARNGNPALPGLPGLTFLTLSTNSPGLSPTGNLLVTTSIAGPGVTTATDTAFWYGPIGNQSLIARESTTVAPGTGGAVLSSSFGALGLGNNYRANNAGQVFFSSNLTGGTPAVTIANNFGTYIGSSTGITEVWRKGNPIPGAPALPATDGPFMTPDTFAFALNGAGEVAHTGTLVAGIAGGVTTANDKVLYTTVGGLMRIAAREGDAAPGGGTYGTSFTLATMGINNAGKVLFTTNSIWYLDDHATVSRVIGPGDAIAGETLATASSSGMFLNNNDRVAIGGTSSAVSNPGRLWTGPLGGPYTKIVEQGVTTAPGDPTVILDFSAGSASIAFNNAGQIVFSSALTGSGVTPGLDDLAVFGWDPVIGLVMIARKGVTSLPELLEVSQITLIGGTGITGENGSATLTDNGWLTFRMQDVKGFQAIIRTRPFDVQPCPADVTGDGIVNMDDLLFIIAHWSETSGPSDLNNDGIVNMLDLLDAIAAYGACP